MPLSISNLPGVINSARVLGYTTLRLAIGMSMLIHGLGRPPHYSEFVEATAKLFAGSTLIEKYDVVGIQLIYSLIFFHLLQHLGRNTLSIDGLIARRRRPSQ